MMDEVAGIYDHNQKVASPERPSVLLKQPPLQYGEKTGFQAIITSSWVLRWAAMPTTYNHYRQIRKHPTIALSRALAVAPILAGEWSVKSHDDADPEWVRLIQDVFMPLRERYLEAALLYGNIDFGYQGFEKVFDRRDGYEVITKLKPLLQDITEICIGHKGEFIGFRQWGTELGLANALHVGFRIEGSYWYGIPLLENIRACWNDWQECNEGAKRYDRHVAGAHWIIQYPDVVVTHNGVKRPAGEVARELLYTLESSGGVCVPRDVAAWMTQLGTNDPGWLIDLKASGTSEQAGFNSRLEYLDKQMCRGLLLPERSVLEGQHGTKAEAETHLDAAMVQRDIEHRYLTGEINRQAVDEVLILNFGPEAKGKVELEASPIVDSKREYYKELYQEVLRNPQSAAQEFANLDLDAMRDALGLPKVKETKKDEQQQQAGDQPPDGNQAPEGSGMSNVLSLGNLKSGKGQSSLFDKPQEGDTREKDGHTYTLHEGRWHGTEQEAPKPADEYTEEEKQKHADYSELVKQGGITPKPIGEWAETYRKVQARIKAAQQAAEQTDAPTHPNDTSATGPQPIDTEEPRKTAEEQYRKDLDDQYIYARKSAVPNAGEDLLGSARHKANAWRGLEDAEKNGTAEQLVNRKMLLKNEPHNLTTTVVRNPLTSLAMHFTLAAFPPHPASQTERELRWAEGAGTVDELNAKNRRQYLEAYRSIRDKAQELAQVRDNPMEATREMARHVSGIIQGLWKGTGEGLAGKDSYNATARQLIKLQHGLAGSRGPVIKNLDEFSKAFKEKYSLDREKWSAASAGAHASDLGKRTELEHFTDALADHAADIMEGATINATFGKSTAARPRGEGFNPAEAYEFSVTRTGGKEFKEENPSGNTEHMLKALKIRAIQHGNTVPDSERQYHLAKASEAFSDLAEAMGVPEHFVSWNGRLGIAFGARGHGNARAHYEPGDWQAKSGGRCILALTRNKGIGSLAHEWGHFFDNMVGAGSGDRASFGTQATIRAGAGDNTPMRNLFSKWHSAALSFRQRVADHCHAKQMSNGKINYWSSPIECFARGFERHVQRKLQAQGRENSYLVGLHKATHPLWPSDQEAESLAPIYDEMIAELKSGVEQGRIAMSSQGLEYTKLGIALASSTSGRWITLGAHKGSGTQKAHGGVHVFIGKDGKIAAGPASMVGKKPGSLGKHLPAAEQLPLKTKGQIKYKEDKRAREGAEADARKRMHQEAGDLGLDPEAVEQTAKMMHGEHLEHHQEHERAKYNARQLTGLSAKDLARVENSGGDYASRIGGKTGRKMAHFDEYAVEIAREHPGLIGNPDDPSADLGARLWDLLRECKQEAPQWHDEKILRAAMDHVHANRNQPAPEEEPIPFSNDKP